MYVWVATLPDCAVTGLTSPKSKATSAIGVGSVSVEPLASAVTLRGAGPTVTTSWAIGAASGIGEGVAVGVLVGLAAGLGAVVGYVVCFFATAACRAEGAELAGAAVVGAGDPEVVG